MTQWLAPSKGAKVWVFLSRAGRKRGMQRPDAHVLPSPGWAQVPEEEDRCSSATLDKN